MCKSKNKLSSFEVYFIIMNANKKTVVQNILTNDQKQWLMNDIKMKKPEDCICCPCFYWKFDNNGKLRGFDCTLNGNPNLEREGECGF